jgi:hypothetical protein
LNTLLRKPVRIGVLALLAAFILFGFTTTLVPSEQHVAHAGSNGQQLGLICYASNLGNVTVRGENQDGNYVTWQGSSPDGGGFQISGWWWKYHVYVDYYTGGQLKHIDGDVPVYDPDGEDTVWWNAC